MVMDFVGGITSKVNRDIDRVKRAMGVTPYRWRVAFITTQEVAEREQAFGSGEAAFYNAQAYIMSRVTKKLSNTFDEAEVTIFNSRTGAPVQLVAKRPLGMRRPIGYWVAELLGYEVRG